MPQSYSLAELAQITACTLEGDSAQVIHGVSDLVSATSQDAVFLSDPHFFPLLERTQAGLIFIRPSCQRPLGRNYLLTDHPERAFQQCVQLFASGRDLATGFRGIHATAVIHPSAKVGKDVTIGPHAVLDRAVCIGDRTDIGPGCYVGTHVVVGQDCVFHAHVTIASGCKVGDRVLLQPGVVIGSPGFGYQPNQEKRHQRLEHVGNVVIEDDVEIGANSTIDQARFGSTRIGRGTKIDNLVQVAHNVQVGEDNIIVAQSGIAGSSSTGRGVVLAGQVGVTDHVHLTDGIVLAARSGVSKSILKSGVYSGAPAVPVLENNRRYAYLRNIEKLHKRVELLEKQSL
jgi:UDP-3-O-[3-hydroxymyristoyl] glucosamine N-acyltransferase